MSGTMRQMEVFAAVVDHGGFGAAADHLRMSQSAVSHTLAAFERATGAALVRRAPVITTTLGEALLPYVRGVLAAARALDVAIETRNGNDATGLVRLAAAPTVAHRLIPELFALWQEEIHQLHTMTGARYAPAQRVHDVSTLLAMVEAHLGVAVMPLLAATMPPDTLTMVELVPRLGRCLVLTGSTDRPWHPHVTRMRDIARESVSTARRGT